MRHRIHPLVVSLMVLTAWALAAGALRAQSAADLSLTKVGTPDPVIAGSELVYAITASNEGPDDASTVALTDPLPAGTTFVSLAAPGGWSCTTPAVGANGTVSCSIATFPVGGASFTLTVAVGAGVATGTVISNTATISSVTPDPHPGAESATATTTVSAANTTFSITKDDAPDPVMTGDDLTYTITASNTAGRDLDAGALSDTLPADTTFVSLAAPAGWSCSAPAVGGTGTVSCSNAPFAAGNAVFTLVVQVASALAPGTVVGNQASLTITDSGRDATQLGSATTQVVSPAVLSASKSVSGTFTPGSTVTYTVTLANAGPRTQFDNPGDELTDVLPPTLQLVSASASSGTAVANLGTNTVTWNGSLAAGGSVTITIVATLSASAAPGSTVSNQATIAYDAVGDGTNSGSALSDDPAIGGAAPPT
ncbi:MAG: hypothetical protein ACM3OB_07760, partial [Acidobacteriota bacterium]